MQTHILSKKPKKIKKVLDFSEKYQAKGNTEVDILGQQINKMSDKLESTISELKTANTELVRDIERKDKNDEIRKEFLSNISHELKTPIALIQGYAEGLKDCINDDVQSRDFYCDVIIDEANRLGFLVNDLLVLSRLSAKTENFNITNVNITEIIESIVRRQQKLLEKDKFEITFKYTEKVEIMADPVKMEQVIYNFISNAVNYSGTSKKIEVTQEIIDGEVKVSVKDYGIGIKSEDLEYVWDRYYRVDKGLQRSTQGTGLGLSIIKGILDYHEFKYGVESTVGEGSTFYFSAKLNKK